MKLSGLHVLKNFFADVSRSMSYKLLDNRKSNKIHLDQYMYVCTYDLREGSGGIHTEDFFEFFNYPNILIL